MHKLFILLTGVCVSLSVMSNAASLRIVTTTPDLGSIATTIGGEDVAVTVLVKGTEDPHFLQARPSMIKEVARADLLIVNGLDLEIGWLPLLIKGSRNVAIQPGKTGYLDASTIIAAKHDHTVQHDRSGGHVHAQGNPHYMLDPACGLLVANLIKDRLVELCPTEREAILQRFTNWQHKLGKALFGEDLVHKYDIQKLARASQSDVLMTFLAQTGETDKLGGWLGQRREQSEEAIPVICDHAAWLYLAERFNLRIMGHMEPKPGLTPTTSHLKALADIMASQQVPVILETGYFPTKYGELLARESGAKIADLAHQVGGRPGTDDYFAMIAYNAGELNRVIREH